MEASGEVVWSTTRIKAAGMIQNSEGNLCKRCWKYLIDGAFAGKKNAFGGTHGAPINLKEVQCEVLQPSGCLNGGKDARD